ncbi:kinase-like domain-containing protein [Penicillium concentricum]|uniref:Serine/threonine-protein kinase ATG1 n=1 Tax=Penicillium concentricum TaxID=293559 RepID=A0A9W9S9H5_9EURO|nr:kinase-like domain-containing protein [Penicillium concentricum]KAJ5372058.1 kinase-like domain-containing protein [Penicillium concentricum]
MSPLRGWRLETTYDDIGQRHHQLKSGAECWRTVKCLGNGSFGDVWEEHCVSGPSPNAIRAVKHLRKRQSKFLEMSKREIQALVTFSDSHTPEVGGAGVNQTSSANFPPQYKQHFVQFLGWFDDLENVYIAMEFLQYGDLQKFIKAPFPEPEAASIVFQVAQALQYMHRKNFVHRDIKPLNILVSSPGPKWHVKVADFGITKNTDGSALGTHYIGSPGYMAPELYGDSSNHYTAAIDVWALGAVAFCLRTGAPPFRTIKHLLDYSRDHRVQFPLRPLGNSSGFCMNFVLGTMADPAERRLTIDHVLAHDWLSGQSDSLEGSGSLGGNSAESQATWEIAPSNAWSNTYDNTATQRPRSSSSTEPLSKPNPKADITPLTVPSLSPPLQEHVSKDQLATEMGNLKLMDSKPGDNEMTATIRPKAARDKSPNTIKAMTDLAATYHKQKKFDQAESIFEEVVSLRREVFGNEHLETINALAQLAATYREQKKYKESEPIDEEIVTLRREKYGDEHPDTVKAMENLVITYREQKKVGQVAQISKQLSLLQQKSLGRPHTHTIDSLGSQDETFQEAEKIAFGDTSDQLDLRLTVVAADRLPKQDFFRFPSPFAVVLVDGKKVFTTSVNLKTLSPYWNDTVDLYAASSSSNLHLLLL